jgi:hypothetical protein
LYLHGKATLPAAGKKTGFFKSTMAKIQQQVEIFIQVSLWNKILRLKDVE